MDSEAARFYNKLLLDKFANNLDFVPLPGDYQGTEYGTYFELFSNETARLKAYIINLAKDPKWIEHPEQGLSQFDPSIYQFTFEHYSSLASISTDEFPKIKQWAQKHLDYLMEEVNQTTDRLLIDPRDKEKSIYEKMIIIGKHPSQQWSSKEEMIEAHETSLAKYRQIFIDKYGFKEFNSPGIVVLNNPMLTGGYYYKDKFYLNVYNWIDGTFKYEVESLTLHETIPGHHMQLDISYHSPHRNYLAAIDSPLCNGFIEGWGLFSEHLGDMLFEDQWAYFGYLQANILRTFRVIADILLHVEGQTPSQVIELAKQYLTTNEESITAEIYRYRVLPGQACGYKIGLEVFKHIVKHKFNVDQMKDLIRSDLLEWYKDVLWKAEQPLDLLLRENRLQWSFDE
ncbi:unnamed protein product [Rotaria sp. Silwood2]|nr:unnamed protein product [Rotaria sp. Silwood2]CAF3033878.1 unnamed protein product [Rotaria sp. Silwood2]CAF3298451.1 unnamed protein product [Rotaria sp. Silwood2]CAF3343004.1 unnamed protein product [Rotaria sp. Silwood2]CAF4153119.1 unnamed protein product [Rotaria sp. Silwood2]